MSREFWKLDYDIELFKTARTSNDQKKPAEEHDEPEWLGN